VHRRLCGATCSRCHCTQARITTRAQSINSGTYDGYPWHPGIHGGVPIVTFGDDAAPQLVDAIDIPVTGTKAKERVDVAALRSWIETHHPHHVLIEHAQAMPKQGASSGFKYGRAVGAIEATATGSIRASGSSSTVSAATTKNLAANALFSCFLALYRDWQT
jgi:hypothetical protein